MKNLVNAKDLNTWAEYLLDYSLGGINDASSFHQEPIKFNTNSTKHTAYAIQWFALAVTLSIIYLVVNTRRLKP